MFGKVITVETTQAEREVNAAFREVARLLGEAVNGTGAGYAPIGTMYHNELKNRDMGGQHPISAISELAGRLEELRENISTIDGMLEGLDERLAALEEAVDVGSEGV